MTRICLSAPIHIMRHRILFRLASLYLIAANCGLAVAQTPVPMEAEPESLVLIIGAGGNAEYGAIFAESAAQWKKMATERKMELTVVGEDTDEALPDRDRLKKALAKAEETKDSSALWLVYIGHGTSERGTTKLNLRGVDVTTKELDQWLRPISRPMIVAVCSSSSSPFLSELSGRNRIVITATRSGNESNYSRFGSYLARVVGTGGADIDHDDEVSLLEAFLAAAGETEKFYREESRLATEHAIFDDNGDKAGSGADFFRGVRTAKSAAKGKAVDGDRARKIIVHSSPDAPRLNPDQVRQRSEIETELEALRLRKESMRPEEYRAAVKPLMLQLARLYETAEAKK
ncbi:MAG: hypothetical protein U0892_05190 [Pirellulales bacterium]